VRGNTALMHARLAIMTLTGDQPLLGPGGAAPVCNGEIYNNPELRAAMAGRPGHVGLRAGDLPTDPKAPASPRLRGMRAIATHDPALDRVVLAQDPFGIITLLPSRPGAVRLAPSQAPWPLVGLPAIRRSAGPSCSSSNSPALATIFPGITPAAGRDHRGRAVPSSRATGCTRCRRPAYAGPRRG
jgi:hypothetical protein